MTLNQKRLTVFNRLIRVGAAAAVALGISHLPQALGLFHLSPTDVDVVAAIATPLLVSLDKWLRYGTDAGEGDSESVPVAVPATTGEDTGTATV